jgi:hypothetical protein
MPCISPFFYSSAIIFLACELPVTDCQKQNS